jgi:hypothetical protein
VPEDRPSAAVGDVLNAIPLGEEGQLAEHFSI